MRRSASHTKRFSPTKRKRGQCTKYFFQSIAGNLEYLIALTKEDGSVSSCPGGSLFIDHFSKHLGIWREERTGRSPKSNSGLSFFTPSSMSSARDV
ncbi:hypothetical protein Nepgr_033330 [Nepenthes gracilis]|uniref:Uncharacterized protein n=1 Tax=Nepenthes gracilis TaxID=150966 RepID=A0AAD3TMG7_NEPGR|nr:hypothetical protein Nepgr_033330 [Nepenthes gracilis]